jgi:hypothetical protein
MTDYTKLAVNDLRAYIWENLKSSGLYIESNYYADGFQQPLVPVIPAQELPEFNNLLPGQPFIVYDWEAKPITQDWWMQEEVMLLNVTSMDLDEVNSVMQMLQDLFRRYDLSAYDLNAFNPNSVFQFHYTAVESIISPEPFKTEGGHVIGQIHILYKYTRKTDSTGRY